MARQPTKSLPTRAEVSTAQSELDDECFRERYLRAATIVKVDVSPVTWAAFEQTLFRGERVKSCRITRQVAWHDLRRPSRILKRLQVEVQRLEQLQGDAE